MNEPRYKTMRDQITAKDGKLVRTGLYEGPRDSGLWANGFEACNDMWHEALERSCMDMSLCRRCGKPVICLPDGLSNICDPCSEMENAPCLPNNALDRHERPNAQPDHAGGGKP
jgi:hypothetical protein